MFRLAEFPSASLSSVNDARIVSLIRLFWSIFPTAQFKKPQRSAIDVNSVAKFRKLFKELNEKEGVTIILTSHYSEDIQELCKNTYYIDLLKMGL